MNKFEIFKDRAGYYRWRLKSGNGTIVASSGEGFVSKGYAIQAARNVKLWSLNARIVDITLGASLFKR